MKHNYSVSVEVFSNNNLTKEVYDFECKRSTLEYVMYHRYERSTIHNLWADEWGTPKSFIEWCSEKGYDRDSDEFAHYDEKGWDSWSETLYPKYGSYCDSFNGCMVKTLDGRTCLSGACGYKLAENHPLPEGVKERAREDFIELVTVA